MQAAFPIYCKHMISLQSVLEGVLLRLFSLKTTSDRHHTHVFYYELEDDFLKIFSMKKTFDRHHTRASHQCEFEDELLNSFSLKMIFDRY